MTEEELKEALRNAWLLGYEAGVRDAEAEAKRLLADNAHKHLEDEKRREG